MGRWRWGWGVRSDGIVRSAFEAPDSRQHPVCSAFALSLPDDAMPLPCFGLLSIATLTPTVILCKYCHSFVLFHFLNYTT